MKTPRSKWTPWQLANYFRREQVRIREKEPPPPPDPNAFRGFLHARVLANSRPRYLLTTIGGEVFALANGLGDPPPDPDPDPNPDPEPGTPFVGYLHAQMNGATVYLTATFDGTTYALRKAS